MADYNFREFEQKWQQFWDEKGVYKADETSGKQPYYVLDMFPYPSGAGLHVGHPLGYIASDIVARYKRHQGFEVLHPMGYDAFGLPAEQYAIDTGNHPAKFTDENIGRYREQLKMIGLSFDWSREVKTSDPAYYKWTQWIFIQFFNSWYNLEAGKAEDISVLKDIFSKEGNVIVKADSRTNRTFSAEEWDSFSDDEQYKILLDYRLAYNGDSEVNWCPALGTVLANDEVKDGVSERGGFPVVKKTMRQWFLRITAFADRLLHDLETIDWPEAVRDMQRNWIGRSVGAEVDFQMSPTPTLPKGEGEVIEQLIAQSEKPGYMTSDTKRWKELKELAREYRKNPTKAEAVLWKYVSDAQLGFNIRRQHTIGKFIVDFVCLDKKLVIEVDGDIHDLQQEYDEMRSIELKSLGFSVIRFRNEEVLSTPVKVASKIKDALNSPTPALPEGEGEVDRVGNMKSAFGSEVISNKNSKVTENVDSSDNSLPFGEGRGGAKITVFTTRPDTIFGATFMVLAPEHSLVAQITTADKKQEVEEYVDQAKRKSERERMAETKKISGVFTGAYAINPFTKKEIPIWIADYVLAEYGKGAIMAVPAHDSRDWAFAKQFGLPIVEVVEGGDVECACYEAKDGFLTNSNFLNGLNVEQAIERAVVEIESSNLGKKQINYRLRDANFSRQRYWGEPYPVIYKDGVPYVLDENELPVELPDVESYKPTGTGESPLASVESFVNVEDGGRRETNTMPGWAGSSWYFMRYMDPHNDKEFVSKEREQFWKNVDFYIGGSEHATGHLLYSRFWHKFLYDRGFVSTHEPFKKLINQGMIQGRSSIVYRIKDSNTFVSKGLKDQYEVTDLHVDVNLVENDILDVERFKRCRPEYETAEFILEGGKYICGFEIEKMSKRWFNVVTPDDVIAKYGCDTFRMYEMFLGPIEQSKPWNTEGIDGVSRFLRKFWNLFFDKDDNFSLSDEKASPEELKILHKTIKKVTEDIERFSLNTCVSSFMICVNELQGLKSNKREILQPLVVLLSPFAPHVCEELWHLLGNEGTVTLQPYPKHNEEYLVESSFEYPVSVNGKLRAHLRLPLDMSKEEVEKAALAMEEIQKWTNGNPPKKVIVVPGKIVNVVV